MSRDAVKIVGQGHGLCFQMLLREWWEKEFSSDVVFVFPPAADSPTGSSQSQTLRAHQSILAAASPLLAEIFGSVSLTEAEHTVIIHDYDPWIFQYALEFIYQGHLSTNLRKNDFQELVRILQDLRVDLSSKLFTKVLQNFRRQNTRTVPLVPANKSSVPPMALKVSMCPSQLPGPLITLERCGTQAAVQSDTVDIELLVEGPCPADARSATLDTEDNSVPDVSPAEPASDEQGDDENQNDDLTTLDELSSSLTRSLAGIMEPISPGIIRRSLDDTEDAERPANANKTCFPSSSAGSQVQNPAKTGNCADPPETTSASSASALSCGEEPSSTKKRKNDDTRVSCEVCHKNVLKHHYREHSRRHGSEKYFDCHQCGRSFFTSGELHYHEKTQHSTAGIHQCPLCSRAFKNSFYLEKHVCSQDGAKPFNCRYCPKGFFKKSVFERHERLLHTGERPFKCEYCDKSFATEVILKRHKAIHGGFPGFQPEFLEEEKIHIGVYKCDLCTVTYMSANALIVHRAAHVGESPKIPCKLCDLSFATRLEERRHCEEKHRELFSSCTVCGKLIGKRVLARHIKGHDHRPDPKNTASEKKFACTVCGKQFAKRFSRDRHCRIHSEVKLYTCTVCDKAFGRNDLLERHMKIHEGKQ